jgi:ATP-dependent protease HslVU (ClpYQ) ATPase subunit
MNRKFFIIVLHTLLVYYCINGQTDKHDTPSELAGMFSRLRENRSTTEKLTINDSVRLIIESYAAQTCDTLVRLRLQTVWLR